MKDATTTPYLIRAIYEWCCDNGHTPYIAVKVDESTKVPMEYVKNGEIVLNVGMDATRNLKIGNDLLQFSARFAGVSREISVPIKTLDERLTSAQANRVLVQANVRRADRKLKVDAMAAAILLQSYLDNAP